MVISNIRDIVAAKKIPDFETTSLMLKNCEDYIGILEKTNGIEQWIKTIKIQFTDLKSFLHVKAVSSSENSNTPPSSKPDIEFHKFSPLIDEYSKLTCSVSWCKSRFGSKSAYLYHMKLRHPDSTIDYSKQEPLGTCRMISKKTNKECGTKLPIKTIYNHLKTQHDVDRPHPRQVLIGFNMGQERTAVFVYKGEEYPPVATEVSTDTISAAPTSAAEGLQGKGSAEGGSHVTGFAAASSEVAGSPKASSAAGCSAGGSSASGVSEPMVSTSSSSAKVFKIETDENRKKQIGHGHSLLNKTIHDLDVSQSPSSGQSLSPHLSPEKSKGPLITIPIKTSMKRVSRLSLGKRKNCKGKTSEESSIPTSLEVVDSSDEPHSSTSNIRSACSPPTPARKLRKRTTKKRMEEYEEDTDDFVTRPSTSRTNRKLAFSSDTTPSGSEDDGDNSILSFSQLSNFSDKSCIFEPEEVLDIEDSDVEPTDSEEFTQARIQNKILRHQKRDVGIKKPHELPENFRFMEDMMEFMKLEAVATANKCNSTMTKNKRNLFTKEDSLLAFLSASNRNFCLEDLRDFTSDKFQQLTYPLNWLVETCEEASKALERLKSHSDLRSFILYEVDRFSTSVEFAETKNMVKTNLEAIATQISSAKLFKKYQKLANNHRQQVKKAELILTPSKSHNAENCVANWNKSIERSEFERDYLFAYEEAIKRNHITRRGLTKWSQWARINLCLSDKSRNGVYQFKFKDYLGT